MQISETTPRVRRSSMQSEPDIEADKKELARKGYVYLLSVNNKIPSREAQAIYIADKCKQLGLEPTEVLYALLNDSSKIDAITYAANKSHNHAKVAFREMTNDDVRSVIRDIIPYAQQAMIFDRKEMEEILKVIYPQTIFEEGTEKRIPGGQWHFRQQVNIMIQQKAQKK